MAVLTSAVIGSYRYCHLNKVVAYHLLHAIRLTLLKLFGRITIWLFNVMPSLMCDRLFRCKVKAGVHCKYHGVMSAQIFQNTFLICAQIRLFR